jgi:two-component system chemotaxis response regulator CheB
MIPIEVLVIGGSANALDALVEMFRQLPEPSLPIAVVIHLRTNEPNVVVEKLQSLRGRRVLEIEDKQPLEAPAIYVAPPNYHVLLERDRTLALSVDPPVNSSRPSIDVLFESAADALGPAVVGVLLAGVADDGVYGLARIQEAGGIALAQATGSGRYRPLPSNGVARFGPRIRELPLRQLVAELARLGVTPEG